MTASESEGWLVEALDDAVPIDGVLEAEEDVENSKEPVVCTKIEEKKRTTRPLTSKKKDKFQEMKVVSFSMFLCFFSYHLELIVHSSEKEAKALLLYGWCGNPVDTRTV